MKLGVLQEAGEDNRVAMLPDAVKDLSRLKIELIIEKGAGRRAFAPDQEYTAAGAKVTTREDVLKEADILLQINPPGEADIKLFPEGKVFIGLLQPLLNRQMVEQLNQRKLTVLSLDAIPRISRAQTMDVLSSQANIAGYKAVLLAAVHLPRFFPMLTTAAGSIAPAKTLVLGAGVAGLQAIATARRLGAVVEVFDVRSAVKEEVKSLGAKFIEVEGAREEEAGGYAVEQTEAFKAKQQEMVQAHARKSDVVITTAQIPGKKAPRLVTKDTVENMKPGSVIVDLAASTGGNCALTRENETINHNGVTIIGYSNLPGTLPRDASKMFGKNVTALLKLMVKEDQLQINLEDEVLRGCCVAHEGKLLLDEKNGVSA